MGQFCSICGSQEEPRQATAFVDTSTSSSDIPDFPLSHHNGQPQQHQQPLLLQQQQQSAVGASSSHPSDYNKSGHGNINISHLDPGGKRAEENDDNERQLAQYRLEQEELARREAIVTTASQTMVPVGNNFGSGAGHQRMMGYQQQQQHNHNNMGGTIMNSYYDPAYAAEAAQAILRTAAHTGGLVFSNDMATHAAMNVSIMGALPQSSVSSQSTRKKSKDIIDMLGKGIWDGVRLGTRGRLAGCGGEDPEYYLDDLAEEILEKMVPTKTSLFGGCPPIVENLP